MDYLLIKKKHEIFNWLVTAKYYKSSFPHHVSSSDHVDIFYNTQLNPLPIRRKNHFEKYSLVSTVLLALLL